MFGKRTAAQHQKSLDIGRAFGVEFDLERKKTMPSDTRERMWYDFDIDNESLEECRDRKLRQCPLLSPVQQEALFQLRTATWDGDVLSHTTRAELVQKGCVCRYNGWQVITKEGLAVLEVLGLLKE